jgi:uncharacterized integral membrane protein
VDCTGGEKWKHTMKINSVSIASLIYFVILLIVMILAFQMQAKTDMNSFGKRSENLRVENVDSVEIYYFNISLKK